MASQPPILTDDDIMRVRSQQRRPTAPVMPPQQYQQPQGGYGRIVTGGPRVAPPVAPSQVVQDYAGAANANASANRTQALTPAEVEQARLQAAATRRDLEQGVSAQQVNQNDLARQRADIEAMTNQLMNVGNLYNRNFRDNDPIVTLGLSPTEREFDRNAEILRQQAQTAFRTPGIGSQSDFEARQMEQAYGLSSTNWDTENEAVLNGLTNRLNERRRALGLEPVDWRQVQASGAQAADPNRVQRGESMGQVGTLPIVPGADGGRNELNNEGGTYVTPQDRQIAGILTALANSHLSAEQTIAQANNILRARGINPLSPEAEASIYSARRNRSRHPGFSPYPTGRSDPNLVTGMANSDVGAGVIASGDALLMGTLDNLTSDPERTRAGMELLREQHPWSSTVGEMAGSLLPGTAAERAASMGIRRIAGEANLAARGAGEAQTIGEMAVRPTGNAMYGAGYGAGTADQNGGGFMERLGGAARGAAMSAAGGEAGDRAVAGFGRFATGSRNAAVRALTDRGIPLTIGDIASQGGIIGRTVSRTQNALESLPVIGDAIRARRADSREGLSRAAFDEALAPIGASTGGVVGEPGVELARTATRNAYADALDHVKVQPDNAWNVSIDNITRRAQNLPPDLREHFGRFVYNRLAPSLKSGNLTGSAYQALRQDIRETINNISGHLDQRDYANVLRRTEAALSGLLRRQSPQTRGALQAADQAYRRRMVMERAVASSAKNNVQPGIPTPNQIGSAAVANANHFGGNAATTRRPFYQLQRDAQNVLPSTLPNSGTVDRAWILQAFPAIASGAAYQAGLIDPKTAALFAGLGLPYTRTGQRALQKILVTRPEWARRVGESIISQRRWGARAGAGVVNPLTDQTPSPGGR